MKTFFNRSMVQKICIISMVCLTIPSLLFSFYLHRKQADEFYTQLIREHNIAIEQATNNADTTLHAISELSMDLSYSNTINDYLSRWYRWGNLEKFPIWAEKQLNEVVSAIKYSLKYRDLGINAVNIFIPADLSTEGDYFWSAERLTNLEFFQNFKNTGSFSALYYLDADDTQNFRSVCGYSSGSADKDSILIIQQINTSYPEICIGYIIFECSPQKIFPSLFSSSDPNGGYLAWFHNSEKSYGAQMPQELSLLPEPSNRGTAFFSKVGTASYICCSMEHFNITVIDTQPLLTDAYPLPVLSLSLILAAFALLQFAVLTIFVHKSFQKIHKDLNLMDTIIAEGFHDRIPVTRKDEVGMIAHRYNILLDKINSLIQETVRRETAQTQAQLKALQYQINPHFIYNTLSIFSGYASQNGQDTLAESIASFGQLLRYNLKNDGFYATIESELRTAAFLINVYNIRYFNQLHLTVDVPACLRQFQIIKFLLQPLLENAILHGLVPPNTSLEICIAIRRKEDFLEIELSDDGNGMSPERLLEVQNNMRNSEGSLPSSENGMFIGLRNIYQRLKLFYGQQAELTIDSEEQCGTMITIRIPNTNLKE